MDNDLQEFCLNSRRWIEFIPFSKKGVPKSCPYYDEQLCMCENCGYYQLRKPSKYKKRLDKLIRSVGDGEK